MPLSMTGYGRSIISRDGRELTVELKSVNHRFLDLSFRMPRSLSFLENDMRTQISAALSRGHVDIFVTYVNTRSDMKRVRIDLGLLDAYLAALREGAVHAQLADNARMTDIMRMEDVLIVEEEQDDQEALKSLMCEALDEALGSLKAMRAREGDVLSADILVKLDAIEAMSREIEAREPVWLEEYRLKLKQRIEELIDTQLDEARLTQEIALIADKAAVDEETVRLRSHIAQMRGLLTQSTPVGRKLDFIVQEMNREINTTGSKSSDMFITNTVVNMKTETEKVREQVQNIE